MAMDGKIFECNSCSYVIQIEAGAAAPQFCPYCRSLMYPGGEAPLADGTDYKCSECGYGFRVPAGGAPPYKCGMCNATFGSTPGRKIEHKL